VNKTCVAPALAVAILALDSGSTGSAQGPAGSFPAVTEELIACYVAQSGRKFLRVTHPIQ
jgi:hypothetical protein